MEALQVLFDKIRSSLEEHEILDRALSNQVDDDSDSDGEESSESKQLKKDFMAKQKEIDLLKKAVPEGLPDDGEFQYFLAVAELQKNIEELKVVKVMSEKNLSFLEQQLQLNENLLVELEERKKRLKQEREEEALAGKTSAEKDRKELAKALDKQIRATRCVYKDFKTFLGEFVVKVAPDREEGSRLAHLMQDLYLTFCDDGPDTYVRLSHLDYDVNEHDVVLLLGHGIIERHPDKDKKDEIRLVNFTE